LILSRNGWCPFGKREDKLLGVSSDGPVVVAGAVPVTNENVEAVSERAIHWTFVMDPRGSQPVILLGAA
jgi:hypothetical protein